MRQVDRQLQTEGVRPVLAHRTYTFAHWPRVKNIVPHHALYNWGRMQDVWLDSGALRSRNRNAGVCVFRAMR